MKDYGKKGYKIALFAMVLALLAFSIGGSTTTYYNNSTNNITNNYSISDNTKVNKSGDTMVGTLFISSSSNDAIQAIGGSNNGIYATSIDDYAIYGVSANSIGAYGQSTGNYGVYGQSQNAIGLGSSNTIKLLGLTGTGNAYACINSAGQIYRNSSPCV